MKTDSFYIPIIDLKEEGEASFLIRPILEFIDPIALQEKPHRHNYQEIIYIKSGNGSHVIDDKQITLKPNTFYTIHKNQVHNFTSGKNLKGYLIRFGNDFLPPNNLESQCSFYTALNGGAEELNSISLQKKEADFFEQLLHQLHTEYKKPQKTFGKKNILQQLLLVLLIQMQRKNLAVAESPSSPVLNNNKVLYYNFLDLLEEKFNQEHQLHFYSTKLLVEGRKLSDTVRCYTGKSAKKILIERLMLEAKRMLTHTNKNQKEIAYDLGFETVPYFSRAFKKQIGLTPKEFKQCTIV